MNIYHPSVEEETKFAVGSSEIEGEFSDTAKKDHLLAWAMAKRWGKHTSLTRILNCHKILQDNLRPDIAGKLRDVNVTVGGRTCPPFYAVPNLLTDWLAKYSDPTVFSNEPDVDGAIRVAHVEFEQIHPFEDGNGRVGRIIMNWQRIMNDMPLFIVEKGPTQMEYYTWFEEE